MGLGSLLKVLGAAGAGIAAPFTGGTSLSFLPALLGGVSAVGGALENTQGARTSTGSISPTLAPEYKTLADLLRGRATDKLNQSMDMSGIQANGITGINDAYAGVQQRSDANLTARGLASSPIAGAVGSNIDMSRAGSIAEFLNTLPQLQRQYQNDDMANAMNVLNFGRGTSSTGTAPGSVAGGAFTSAAEMLAYLSGKGLFGGGAVPKGNGSGGSVAPFPALTVPGDIWNPSIAIPRM